MAVQTATATFDKTQPLSGGLPYIDVTWTAAYSGPTAYRISHGVNIADSSGPVTVNFANKTGSGVRVFASAPFSGTVELIGVDV